MNNHGKRKAQDLGNPMFNRKSRLTPGNIEKFVGNFREPQSDEWPNALPSRRGTVEKDEKIVITRIGVIPGNSEYTQDHKRQKQNPAPIG
jgi:hypothetical protein